MIINMTTFAGRMKHYIDRTLESLHRSDGRDVPLNLILGSSDSSHVEQYRSSANLIPWDAEAASLERKDDRRWNCNLNALRALRYGDDEYCVCCEDDIEFKENWLEELMRTIEEIERKDYVLNLGQGGGEQVPGKRYAIHTKAYLCGAQAIFYPSKTIRSAAADFVWENIRAGMNDMLVGRYAKQYAALYNTTPMLIHHIGQTSSFSRPPGSPPPDRGGRRDHKVAKPADRGGRRDHVAAKPPAATRKETADKRPSVVPLAGASDRQRREKSRAAAQETVLALLRASLETAPPPDANSLSACDWGRVQQLATHHGLTGILYRALHPGADGVPQRELRLFKAQYVANAYRGHLARACVDEVGAAFDADGIPVIVMKGAALLRTLYDDPGQRVIGDVDLLVDPGALERATARLQALGMQPFASDHEEARGPLCHIHHVYCRPEPRALPVELHWRLFEPYQPYVFDLDAVRANARPVDGLPANVSVMAPEHELAHLCVHLDRHAVIYRSLVQRLDWREMLTVPQGLARLVWLYDIALYVKRRGNLIDWDRFVDTARRWAMDDRIHATLELSSRALGVGPPPGVLEALRARRLRFVERLAHRVVVASHRANELPPDPSSILPAERLSRLSGHAQRFANTWISLFPPDAYLRARYTPSGSALQLRSRHLKEVVPGFWAEARERLGAAAGRRNRRPAS